jgi:GAF domain-containing protein
VPMLPRQAERLIQPGLADREPAPRAVLDTTSKAGLHEDDNLDATLTQLAHLAARTIPGANGVGLTLLLDEDLHGYGVATGSFVHVLEAQQRALGEGPGILAAQTANSQQSDRLETDARWPVFGLDAARLGVHSALSVPLLDGEGVLGTVDVYSYRPAAFDLHAVSVAAGFAETAVLATSTAQALERSRRLVLQLNELLCDRQDVDRAVGILVARAGCSPADALSELHECAAECGRSVQDTSRALVERATEAARAAVHDALINV